MDVSDDLIQEQAYLISRAVRPLAILGSVSLDELEMQHQFVRLNQLTGGQGGVIPFVLPRRNVDCAMVGFASEQWVIDLLEWSYSDAPLRQQHCIVGILLGYSARDIATHDFREFAGNPMALSMSNSLLDGRTNRE